MKYIIDGKKFSESDLLLMGGKARSLAQLQNAGLPVPQWFVIKTEAWFDTQAWRSSTSASEIGDEKAICPSVTEELVSALKHFEDDARFAVRSSGLSEDGAAASFAGQYETYLWISKKDVAEHISQVWQSAFTERVKEYRQINKITGEILPPAVLVQRMVKAEKSGVAFAANPVTGDPGECVISAIFGLGTPLVDGTSNADTYHYLYKEGTVRVSVGEKDLDAEPLNKIVSPQLFGEQSANKSSEQVLTHQEAEEVALLAKKTTWLHGSFQDIEWAYENGRLHLLQSRPITSLKNIAKKSGRRYVFDNSNITESYSGTTTPLTFSFIRKAYAGVYEQFCRVFGVSEKTIAANERIFPQMLAFIDNRVYYNLFSWYKMLSLLPGYAINRNFMEGMMGVKEPLPESFLEEIHNSVTQRGKASDVLQLLRCLGKLFVNFIRLETHIKKFLVRLEDALDGPSLENLRVDELYDTFSQLEKSLLKKWDAPIENDFFAMIFHGLLKALCEKYDLPPGIHNELLVGQGGIISTKPAEIIASIAVSIKDDEEAVKTLSTGSLLDIHQFLEKRPVLEKMFAEYLGEFADRCTDELKLESVSLADYPLPLYRAVGSWAARVAKEPIEAMPRPTAQLHPSNPPDWKAHLKGHPIRKALFSFVLKNAVRMVRNRENLRFERTRLFGRVRTLFLCTGIHFTSQHALENHRDIFYLTLEEIFGAIDGTAAGYELKQLVNIRKQEQHVNDKKDTAGRIFASGIAGFSPHMSKEDLQDKEGGTLEPPDKTRQASDALKGLPCCAGTVTGRARIVTDPSNTDFSAGDILVARSTDPGWIVLFSLAAGIITERGSLLSHAAIVSREMGIPCVVSTDDAMSRIPDGSTITLDGASGVVTLTEKFL